MSVFYTSCGQNQTDVPEAYIKSEFKDTVTSYGPSTMVRNVKQAKNGDILIAAYNGVFRYDGKLFTNITGRIPFSLHLPVLPKCSKNRRVVQSLSVA